MGSRERQHDERSENEPQSPAGPDRPDKLSQYRAEAEKFLHAGDAAIRKALSRDSSAFLAASRQQGGQ